MMVNHALLFHRSLFLEQTIAARLVELSSSQSMYRFFIQTPDGKALILVRGVHMGERERLKYVLHFYILVI